MQRVSSRLQARVDGIVPVSRMRLIANGNARAGGESVATARGASANRRISSCKGSCERPRDANLPASAIATVGTPTGDCVTLAAMTLLTIREAAHATGHSTHKIRRLIKAIADDPKHPDRSHVEPSPTDVERLAVERVQFTWRISEEFVRRQLGATPPPAKTGESRAGESDDLFALLQRAMAAKEHAEAKLFDQLKTKDDQIIGLQQTVTSLNERLRESNMLMASIQRQLPEGKRPTVGILRADGSRLTKAVGKRSAKSASAAAKPVRRRWLKALFS